MKEFIDCESKVSIGLKRRCSVNENLRELEKWKTVARLASKTLNVQQFSGQLLE